MTRPLKPHPDPVIEALRQRIRLVGISRVADEFGFSITYIRRLSTGFKPMTPYVAGKLGFERVWLPKKDLPKKGFQ
jgi:hypothetical protein